MMAPIDTAAPTAWSWSADARPERDPRIVSDAGVRAGLYALTGAAAGAAVATYRGGGAIAFAAFAGAVSGVAYSVAYDLYRGEL